MACQFTQAFAAADWVGGAAGNEDRQLHGYAAQVCFVAELAQSRGLSPAEMALAFVRTRWFVASSLIGATDLAQLKQNIDSVKIELDATTLEGIDAIHRRYPSPAA